MPTSAPAPASTTPLPSILTQTTPPPQLLTQGAEAHLYQTTYLSAARPAALKYRPPKPYRHPALDARLTKHRILAEARVLAKLRREGASVPAVYAVDWEAGWLLEEWVAGQTVRSVLDAWMGRLEAGEGGEVRRALLALMGRVGAAVGEMHKAGVVHGDLTTSNLMVKGWDGEGLEAGEVVLIDFGLAAQSVQDEDRAVDMYVLERAFGSTHPRTEDLFQEVLRAYERSYKGAKVVVKRLEEVRMRGRKKIMIG